MPRRILVSIIVAVLVLALAAGGFVWWTRAESTRLQGELVARLAASLSSGTLVAGDFAGPVDPEPAAQYATIVKGMKGLKPTVTTSAITQTTDDASTATLHYAWTPPGHDAWAYDVTIDLSRTDAGWKAAWSPAIVAPELRPGERLLYNRLAPERGSVLGQDDAKLAYNQPAVRVGIDKTRLVPAGQALGARTLAEALTKGGVATDPAKYAAKVAAAGPKAFVEAALLRANDPAQAALVKTVKTLPGVHTAQVTKALGVSASFLRPILGQVGDATAEIVDASAGQVVAGDQVGTAGLQRTWDAALRGKPGYVVQAVDADGKQARDLIRVAASPGTDVKTTIDADLQRAAERILADVSPASAIVAIRPSDGALLTVASGPGSAGVASTATQALYEPGSTFKTVSGLAMLRHGLTPASTLTCTPSITVDGYTFANDQGYPSSALGRVPWTSAFAHSCNTAVISQAGTVSQADLASAATSLGLIGAPSIGVTVTSSRVPAEAGSETEHAASMIGQGKVLATPLGMATVMASIVEGRLVRPALVTSPTAPQAASPDAPATVPLTDDEGAALRKLMRGVVTGGTATSALAGTPGGPIIAKTGTATYIKDGKERWHTWLIAGQGDLAVAVMVADGDFGAATCGPLLKAYLTAAHDG